MTRKAGVASPPLAAPEDGAVVALRQEWRWHCTIVERAELPGDVDAKVVSEYGTFTWKLTRHGHLHITSGMSDGLSEAKEAAQKAYEQWQQKNP